MAAKDPTKTARKWADRLANSTEQIRDGVQAVTKAPTISAAENIQAMQARFNQAITSGKTERALRAVSLSGWQEPMLTKGLSRIADGAQAAIPKQEAFLAQLLPYTNQVSNEIAKMPNSTPEQRRARMNANFDKMSAFKYNRR